MKQILNQSDETEVAISEPKNEFTAGKSIRKPLREWGFEVAGLNRGEATALESHLRCIQQGHIVDETYNAEDEKTQKNKTADEISRKEKEQSDIDKDKQHIKDVIIADKEDQIASNQSQIETRKIQLAEGKINSNYNEMRFWLYASLCTLISFYLIFFYASVIHSSFFRSMQQIVNSGSNDDITLTLNSIFDPIGIFQWHTQLIFTYLGAFIFFGFGILPHIFGSEDSRFKTLKVVAAILICLIVDSLLAYKIDSGIHDLKIMVGIADADWVWYKSINFYLVLAFGFGTYLLWGILYEAALTEHEKKNINAKVEIEIIGLKDKIRALEMEIITQKEMVKDMQKQIDALKLEIEKLKKQMEQAFLRPEELKRNMEHFYAGWLAYLHGISEQNSKLIPCEVVYRKFQESINIHQN